MTVIFGVLLLSGISIAPIVVAEQIPSWVKNTAKWWGEGQISESDFLLGLEFLINEDILIVPPTQVSAEKSDNIPSWVKNTAKWWGEGQISDDDFLNGINHLMTNGIISVKQTQDMPELLFAGSFDLSKAGHLEGFHDAAFTIIMFSDHQCEKCAKWMMYEKNMLMTNIVDAGTAKFFLLDYPFLGEDSTSAAEATYCAEDQGKFSEYLSILAKKHNGIQTGWADHNSLVSYASDLGLDTKKFDQCLFWDRHALRVDHNRDVATSHGVVGTPIFFVVAPDGTAKRITGPQPSMIFESVINELR